MTQCIVSNCSDFSHERCIHMGEELALLVAHLCVLLLRDKSDSEVSTLCANSISYNPATTIDNDVQQIRSIFGTDQIRTDVWMLDRMVLPTQ